ncbi:MAG: RagB/SusD family nutrient uptake outer membrane protein [Dysgonomonas sp.]
MNEGIDYNRALTAAKEAMKKTGLTVLPVADFLGWNKKTSANAMWALEVIATQSEGFPGFFSHMDADAPGMYASRARRIISTGLYNLIPSTDERKIQWWRAPMSSDKEQTGNSMVSYCQLKFRYANVTTRIGDYLIMRVEEMILIAAEAEARLDNYTEARRYLQLLGDKRDPKYADRLAGLVNGKTYGSNTLDAPTNVLEEVLLQRRIELWGEYPRGFDLKRLRLGYNRTYTGSNHTYKIQVAVADKRLTLPIPQAEFDGNVNMDQIKDQNPM